MTGLPTLRSYQVEPARAITDSVINNRGLTFTVEMSRQSGKNELSAQLETTILALANAQPSLFPTDVTIVKAAPTLAPQARLSILRLQQSLRRAGLRCRTDEGHIVRVGNAAAIFLSAEPGASIVGHTATPLLELDEAQDIAIEKYDKDLRPMAAAFNATTVLYGTAWSDLTLLHREREHALNLEGDDGVRRAFSVPWTVVAPNNPAYAAYVAAERDRLGPNHPLFYTQYELREIPGKGRLFDPATLIMLKGTFERRREPPPVGATCAGLDIGGGDDTDGATHDRTVLTLGAVTPAGPADPIPDNHLAVLDHQAWQGTPHELLLPALIDTLLRWRPKTLAVDATGIGEPTARALAARLPRTTVVPIKFTRPSKSELGYALLAAAQTGRLKLYASDEPDAATCWAELAAARADYLTGPGQYMNFYVNEHDGHDDYLISLALCNSAAARTVTRTARGRNTA